MAKLTKKRKLMAELVEAGRVYSFDDAFNVLQTIPKRNFIESVDVSINLGVDAKKSDQVVRGSTVLPFGTGKTVRVAVFASGKDADSAKAAGADIVGMEDLADSIKAGNMDFDVVIAHPSAMGVVGRLGQVLGPRGLMPNPKVGTVSPDVANAVKNAKSGQVRYRTDKNGIIHCTIGKISFEAASLQGNLTALLSDLKKAKPSSAKGVYLKKVTLSTTMGPGLVIDFASI
jgi:large subunit ribosomal protein L1